MNLDRMTPMAVGGAFVCVVLSMLIDGSNPAVLFKPAPIILVLGGTLAAAAAGFMKRDVKDAKNTLKAAMGVPEHDVEADIEQIFEFATIARKDGLLALESAAKDVEDPFLRTGVQLAVDGVDSEEMEAILEGEINAAQEHHRTGAKFFADLGGFSPTLGIIGTVVGLIHVLQNLNNPATIGPAIGSAFTATLWGVLLANVVWLPISNKLKRASQLEVQRKRMILDGLLAVQAGSTPRMIKAKMQSHLSPAALEEARAEAA